MPQDKECGICGKDTEVRLPQGCLRCYVSICHSELPQSDLFYHHHERWTCNDILAADCGSFVLRRAFALLLQGRKPQVHTKVTAHPALLVLL